MVVKIVLWSYLKTSDLHDLMFNRIFHYSGNAACIQLRENHTAVVFYRAGAQFIGVKKATLKSCGVKTYAVTKKIAYLRTSMFILCIRLKFLQLVFL